MSRGPQAERTGKWDGIDDVVFGYTFTMLFRVRYDIVVTTNSYITSLLFANNITCHGDEETQVNVVRDIIHKMTTPPCLYDLLGSTIMTIPSTLSSAVVTDIG